MTPETLHITGEDGATFDLIVHPAAHGTFLYWLPALGVTARHYARFAELLAASGIGLARHEWRGGGSSNLRASRKVDWRYRDLLGDIRAGLAALRARHPKARIVIGGHSLGAQLGLLSLARDLQLDSFVVVAGGTPYWRAFPFWQRPLLVLGLVTFRLLASLCGYFPGRRVGFGGDEARSLIHDWAQSGLHGRYRHVEPHGDLDAELRTRRVSLLAIHLRDDGYVPGSACEDLIARLPEAEVTRVHLAPEDFASGKADHFSWMKDPAAVVVGIHTFLHTANLDAAA